MKKVSPSAIPSMSTGGNKHKPAVCKAPSRACKNANKIHGEQFGVVQQIYCICTKKSTVPILTPDMAASFLMLQNSFFAMIVAQVKNFYF